MPGTKTYCAASTTHENSCGHEHETYEDAARCAVGLNLSQRVARGDSSVYGPSGYEVYLCDDLPRRDSGHYMPSTPMARPQPALPPEYSDDETLNAKEFGGNTWKVTDLSGGIWHPNDEASEEIRQHVDPPSRAVQICRDEPMRGKWCC